MKKIYTLLLTMFMVLMIVPASITSAENTDVNTFVVGGTKYRLGFGNLSSDGQTLHIDDGSCWNKSAEDQTPEMLLIVAELNSDDNIVGTASQSIINDVIINSGASLSVTCDTTSQQAGVTITRQNSTVNIKDKAHPQGVDTYNYDLLIPANYVGNIDIHITFNGSVGGEAISPAALDFYYHIEVQDPKTYEFDVDSLDSKYGSDGMEKLNTILSSRDTFMEFFNTEKQGVSLKGIDSVVFNFNSSTIYEGYLEIDLANRNNQEDMDAPCQIIFNGNSLFDDNSYYNQYVYGEDLNLYTYDSNVPRATIKGTITNYCGLKSIKNMKFIASDPSKKEDTAIQVVQKTSTEIKINDIWEVFNSYFEGYKYALKSDNGLISGVDCSMFKGNETAIYVSTPRNCNYSDSLSSYYVDNDVAIDIETLPEESNAYQFVYAKNYFFGDNQTDIKLGKDVTQGADAFFFINSYFGSDYSEGIKGDNLRSAKTSIATGCKAKAITSPCIRYPEKEYKLGFNPDTSNNIVNGQECSLYKDGLLNPGDSIKIEVCEQNGEAEVEAAIYFGGKD